jgi:hypothetical protein
MKINIQRLAGGGLRSGSRNNTQRGRGRGGCPCEHFARPRGNFRLRRLGHASANNKANKAREGQARVARGPSYA